MHAADLVAVCVHNDADDRDAIRTNALDRMQRGDDGGAVHHWVTPEPCDIVRIILAVAL
jgi:hypothetical protein